MSGRTSKAAREGKPAARGAGGAGARVLARSLPANAGAEATEAELSLELRETLARLYAEREEMRRELENARAAIAALERLADEDALAPIANRRAFVRELSRMIAYSRRYKVPASVIYFDVNGLKQINDAHGHPAGDAALRHIAEILRANIRESDVVGRLGGDEFGVVLAQANQDQATAKGAVLARAIAAAPLQWGGAAIAMSAAYGVYSFTSGDDAQAAIEAADRAMYRHKRETAASA